MFTAEARRLLFDTYVVSGHGEGRPRRLAWLGEMESAPDNCCVGHDFHLHDESSRTGKTDELLRAIKKLLDGLEQAEISHR